ncbi:histone H1 [Pedobacter panaciterrae]|uniref:Histone H1 n=1 Tax=Pedobacter panaciterrae TaxID=363849 RepID=A0ABU8NKA1_9SPHI
MKSFESLKAIIQGAEKDALKFYLKGNKAAGTRLRNAMQQSKLLAQDVRKSVLAAKSKKK